MTSDDDEPESALSPLVTAQDRKRMIVERRRKEREQQTQDTQASTFSVSTTRATTTIQQESSSAFGFLKKRRRSDVAPARAMRLFSASNDDVTPKASRSTLFGAVMERTSSNAVGTPTRPLADLTSSTPLRSSGSRVSWNDAPTPSSSSRSKSFLTANSPGGFALLRVLDSVASPFHHKAVDKEQVDENDENDVTPAQENRLEEWQEGYLKGGGVMDWSIKRKLRIECHPGSCLPHDWEDAMRYWQHPAMYPLPAPFGEEKDDQQSQSTNVSATMPPTSMMADMVRGRDAILHRLVRKDPTLWRQRRNREWQEAFRSLYLKWCQQVESLQRMWKEGEDAISSQAMTQTSFYAMAPGQVVLFRVGMETANAQSTAAGATDQCTRIVPMIVMSSTTLCLRSKLRSMGATLLYFQKDGGEFEESILEHKKPQSLKDESEEVHQELEALRRAQAHGETAGADVSVATKTRTAASKSPRSVPPLCIMGEDDCAAFFEMYLNTLGRYDTPLSSWCKGNGDVPLLLSRKVGHFLHASLQSLVVTSRREESDSSQHTEEKAMDRHASMELRGPILPCALQELIGAAASRMMEDTTENKQPSKDDDVGSHYFVVQLQTHDGEERPRVDSTTTGTAGSGLMNDGDNICSSLADEGPSNCEYGEVVNMAVWDIARPNMIAYKTETSVLHNERN